MQPRVSRIHHATIEHPHNGCHSKAADLLVFTGKTHPTAFEMKAWRKLSPRYNLPTNPLRDPQAHLAGFLLAY
jgi:hypothetical protein